MPHPTRVVKVPLTGILRHCGVRTLRTFIQYADLPLPAPARRSHGHLQAHLQAHLRTPAAREHLRSALTSSDIALFWAILAARDLDLAPTLRLPWQLAAPWPPLTDLHPLERLMALACLVPVQTPRGLRIRVPDQLAAYLGVQKLFDDFVTLSYIMMNH